MANGSATASQPAQPATAEAPLDDLMLAMDVVDTLRHDMRIAERELGDDERRATLKKRLKEIYSAQGIDVPDSILEDGVKALEEDRFVYKGHRKGFGASLAQAYVDRGLWAKRLLILAAVAAAAFGAWYVGIERPRVAAIEAQTSALADTQTRIDTLRAKIGAATQDPALLTEADRAVDQGRAAMKAGDVAAATAAADRLQGVLDAIAEIDTVLPARLDRVKAGIAGETKDPAVTGEVDKLVAIAQAALAKGDAATARDTADKLERLLAGLRQTYVIRIAQGQGKKSGVFRIPKVNEAARNYYLIVEAIGPDGKPVSLPITSEETKQTKVTSTWGVRVPQQVYNAVAADKSDNGIVDNDVVGEKKRGETQPQWRVPVAGGAITEW
ncbi:MAG: DUF6384 family protein [Hyphomicrobiales bacterium]